jgi:hypothetical protein
MGLLIITQVQTCHVSTLSYAKADVLSVYIQYLRATRPKGGPRLAYVLGHGRSHAPKMLLQAILCSREIRTVLRFDGWEISAESTGNNRQAAGEANAEAVGCRKDKERLKRQKTKDLKFYLSNLISFNFELN